jgi:hypothetical protein
MSIPALEPSRSAGIQNAFGPFLLVGYYPVVPGMHFQTPQTILYRIASEIF